MKTSVETFRNETQRLKEWKKLIASYGTTPSRLTCIIGVTKGEERQVETKKKKKILNETMAEIFLYSAKYF